MYARKNSLLYFKQIKINKIIHFKGSLFNNLFFMPSIYRPMFLESFLEELFKEELILYNFSFLNILRLYIRDSTLNS